MRRRIVIADSNEVLLAVYRAFLAAEGFEVVTVTSGLDCLNAFREATPAALIIDPDILGGGYGFLGLMSGHADVPPVPALILTRHPETVAQRVLPSSQYAVLIKPVAPAVVAEIIRALVAEMEAEPEGVERLPHVRPLTAAIS